MQNDLRLIDANALLKEFEKRQKQQVNEYCDCFLNDAQELSTEWWCVEDAVMSAPTISAVPVVRCRECKNGAPLPEEARDEFSPGVMRCLAGRGDCDKYCTTWEDGFCDEGAKMDAKDIDVPTKDGGAV